MNMINGTLYFDRYGKRHNGVTYYLEAIKSGNILDSQNEQQMKELGMLAHLVDKENFDKIYGQINKTSEGLAKNQKHSSASANLDSTTETAMKTITEDVVERGENIPDSSIVLEKNENNSEISSIKEQLRNNSNNINSMTPVADYSYIWDESKLLSERRNDILEKFLSDNNADESGNAFVSRSGFGDISIGRKDIKQGFKYLNGQAEYSAVFAIPDVLRNGIEIGKHANHKGRDYPTVTFAAPVVINGKRGNMAVTVKITGKNKYKMHRLLTPQGTLLSFDNAERSSGYNDRMTDVSDGESLSITTASNDSISHSGVIVNSDFVGDLGENPVKVAETKATEAAYEAGRANVPRESVTLETPEQEIAYNEGRIEYIKNMNSENLQNDADNSVNKEYTQSETIDGESNTISVARRTGEGIKKSSGVVVGEDTGYSLAAVEVVDKGGNKKTVIVETTSGLEFGVGGNVEEALDDVLSRIANVGREKIDAMIAKWSISKDEITIEQPPSSNYAAFVSTDKGLANYFQNDIIVSNGKTNNKDTKFLEGDYYERKESKNSSFNDIGKRRFSWSSSGGSSQLVEGTGRFTQSPKARQKRGNYARTLRLQGKLRTGQTVEGITCDIIPHKHFNSEMRSIAKDNLKHGIAKTVFVSGNLRIVDDAGEIHLARGAYIDDGNGGKTLIVQYDNFDYSPKQINYHEQVHNLYNTERVQKVKNAILGSLSVQDRLDTFETIERNLKGLSEITDEVIEEELCADVLSGMDYYRFGTQFEELRTAFWNGDDAFISNFKKNVKRKKYDLNDILYDKSASKLYKGDVFPKGSSSEAGPISIMWANRDDVEYGTVKVVSYQNNSYYIVKTADSDVKYRIIGHIRDSKHLKYLKKIEEKDKYGINNRRYSGVRQTSGAYSEIQKNDANIGGRSGSNIVSDKYDEKTRSTGELDGVENGRWSSSDGRYTDNESSGTYYSGRGNGENHSEGERRVIRKFSLDDTGVFSLEDALNEKIEKYGAISAGEKPSRDVQIPRKTSKDKKVSQTVRTILEAKATPDEAVPDIEKLVVDGVFSYDNLILQNQSGAVHTRLRFVSSCISF